MISNYQSLKVWQKAITFISLIYKVSQNFPQREIYGLTNQMRRSAISIPSNIAEGSQRKTKKDFLSFLRIAKGSTAELETQLIIALNLNYLTKEELRSCQENLLEIRRMLSGFISKISTPNSELRSPNFS